MMTHNICFYENLTKNIFELSSNIIKYAPYFFNLLTIYSRPSELGEVDGLQGVSAQSCALT